MSEGDRNGAALSALSIVAKLVGGIHPPGTALSNLGAEISVWL
jgi:hypothetical protein